MLDENNFHKLIEQQEGGGKQRVKQRVEAALPEATEVQTRGPVLAVSADSRRRILVLVSLALALVIAAAVAIGLVFGLKKKNPIIRYIGSIDCEVIVTDVTLKQYSAENGKNYLYFDEYEDALYFDDTYFKDIKSGKLICYNEYILFPDETYLTFCVTDDRTEIDIFDAFKASCVSSETINGVEVKYTDDYLDEESAAYFTYKGNIYYLEVDDAEPGYARVLARKLLENAAK